MDEGVLKVEERGRDGDGDKVAGGSERGVGVVVLGVDADGVGDGNGWEGRDVRAD